MKPSDALQQDWRLYYDQAWMDHRLFGPGLVRVLNNRLFFYRFPDDEMEPEGLLVRGSDLQCWWPRSGSYNVPGGAIYIARRTTRSMRKSAHPVEHYKVKWGNPIHSNNELMLQLRAGPAIVDADFAKKAIDKGMTNSAAVSTDVILTSHEDSSYGVVFRGINVGEIEDDIFIPDYPASPLARRAESRLIEDGII